MLNTLDLGRWCILRMASSDTIGVCQSLNKLGIEAWTPIERRMGRMPRTRKIYDKTFPIMPSYVFASVDALDELVSMSALPMTDCPPFTMFRHGDGLPLVADMELDALRQEEAHREAIFDKAKARHTKSPTFDPGAAVLFSEGGFEGLTGKVIESKGRFTLVDVEGFPQPLKIASLLLQKDVLTEESQISGANARAA